MQNNKLIDDFLELKKTSNKSKKGHLSEKTIELYRKNLEYLSNFLGKPFKQAEEKEILESLKGLKQATKNNRIVTYRDFYRYIYNLDENEKLPDCIRRIKTSKIVKDDIEYRERIITNEQYQKIVDFAFNPLHKAIIEALWITGARKDAIHQIKSDGVYYDGKFTRIIISKSKTNTREFVYPDRAENLLLWAEELQPHKGQNGKPLFAVKIKGLQQDKYKAVNNQYAYRVLQRICKRIQKRNPDFKTITPHDFRHTRCTEMLKRGIPETHVKTLLGFTKNTDMLKIYDHNRTKDYEDWLEDKIKQTKPTYQLLKKQKETIEKKHEKEIEELKEQVKMLSNYIMEDLEGKNIIHDIREIKKDEL